MGEIKRIAEQFERSQKGEAWHGPALLELVGDIKAAQALGRPVAEAHNIWEIVLHVTVWQKAAAGALRGKPMPNLEPTQDWPASGKTEKQWQTAVASLKRAGVGLGAAIRQFDDSRMGEQVTGRDYSYYFLMHGIVQHSLYHAGQIALLKKAAT